MIMVKLNIFPKITMSALTDGKKKALKIGFTILTLMYFLHVDKKAMAFSLYGDVVAMFIITIFFQALIHCFLNAIRGETTTTEITAKFCSALALAIVFYYVHINADTTLRNFIMIRNLALIIIGFLWTNNNKMMFRTNLEAVEKKNQEIQKLTNDVNDLQKQLNEKPVIIDQGNKQ